MLQQRHCRMMVFAAVLLLVSASAQAQLAYRYTEIVVPGEGLFAQHINDKGEVIGLSVYNLDFVHGFFYDKGVITNIDAVPDFTGGTQPRGGNNRGQIVGNYFIGYGCCIEFHGFVYDNGVFSEFAMPGAINTTPLAINDSGQIVGIARVSFADSVAFVYDNGVFTTFEVQGTTPFPTGINNRGQIVGYFNKNGIYRGFIYDDGVFKVLDGPVAGTTSTFVTGINDRGQVVGYAFAANKYYSFLYDHRGVFTLINPPAEAFRGSLEVMGINNRGEIVGSYFDTTLFEIVGFVATPSRQ